MSATRKGKADLSGYGILVPTTLSSVNDDQSAGLLNDSFDDPHGDPELRLDPHERVMEAPPGEGLRLVATIIKAFIGSGVLFLPKAFENGGWLFSTLVMVFMAVLTQITIMRLVECRQRVVGSYSFVGFKAYGRKAQVAVDICLILSQAGFCCVYIAFIARNVLQLLNVNSCWVQGDYLWVLILIQLPILTPLTWIRKIQTFGWTSLTANVFIACGLLGILIYSGVEWKESTATMDVTMYNSKSFPLFLGTAVYAYEGIGMVVPIYDSLSIQGQRRFPFTLTLTLLVIAGVYIIVGLVPYLYVSGIQHAVLQDAITLNLPRVWWTYVILAAYCVALVFSYPLMLFPAVKILERGVASYLWNAASDEKWKRNMFRTAIVAATLLVSYLGSSQLTNLVSLVGCFCCTPLAFIFPALFHYRLVGGSLCMRLSNIVIAIFGIAVFIFSTYQAIATWSISTIDACLLTPGHG